VMNEVLVHVRTHRHLHLSDRTYRTLTFLSFTLNINSLSISRAI
jgi:hypothetical protein